MIELIKLSKTFKANKKENDFVALNNVNLTVENGDIFGVIGLSGAGKSTLVRCINLLEKPDDGKILIDGEQMSKRKDNLGYMLQKDHLFPWRTIEKNIFLNIKLNIRRISYHEMLAFYENK